MSKFIITRVVTSTCVIEAETEEDAWESILHLSEEDFAWSDSEETIEEVEK